MNAPDDANPNHLPASEPDRDGDTAGAAGDDQPTLKRPVKRPTPPKPPARPAATPDSPPTIVSPPMPPAATSPTPTVPPAPAAPSEGDSDDQRKRPIPPPSERKQYRAIGLLKGCYQPSEEHFTRGTLTVADGTEIKAVLLGRVMSLVKKHINLEEEHLWVVYPRTRGKKQDSENQGGLHVQIVGVWEPETLQQDDEAEDSDAPAETTDSRPSDDFEDNYFSVRGEVVACDTKAENVVVRIQQAPKRESEAPRAFKLYLKGILPSNKTIGYFWDLQAQRQADALVIDTAEVIGLVPPKKRSKHQSSGPPRKGGIRKPGGHTGPHKKPKPNSAAPGKPEATDAPAATEASDPPDSDTDD